MLGPGTGSHTGIHTPRSSQNLRPLTLSHGSLEYSFLIPTNLHYHASQLKDTFKLSLPAPTDELAQDDEPSSVAELVARYIGFTAREIDEDDDAQGNFIEVLKIVLNEFERSFMRANDVHALTASLPGITSKKLLVVRSYYAGRAAVLRPIKAHDSALLRQH
jgi:fatty acid synthase subunit beta, fungi type